MATIATYATLSASDHSTQLRKAVIAATIGTAIEWYDFFIYGTAAGLIFGRLFFPNEDPLTATLAAFGTFFVAFVPAYESIGIWGAVILTVLRMIQGIGVGGEWGGSVLLAMEWSRHS